MLLELARDTLAHARQHAALPIPVVFNLSSWTDPKQSLAAWLVDELINKYHAPKKVAQGWVEQDKLLLLLDGLDEVRVENRQACAQAINTFRQAHGLNMPLVVCSRIADYEALSTRLQLRGAVLLQPLTDAQIDDYFEHAGSELAPVRHAWRQDTELQELARQPLMLSIVTLAYRGAVPEVLASEQAGSLETRRKHLFNAYIQKMFARTGRTRDERYTPQETTHYLAWLAQALVQRGQSVFLLENMRRSWLPDAQERLHRVVTMLIIGLACGLTVGLTGELMSGLVFGLLSGLMGGLASSESPVERLKWSWMNALGELPSWLVYGLLISFAGGLGRRVLGLGDGLVRAFGDGVWGWLVFGLMLGLWSDMLLGGLKEVEMETKTVPNQGIQVSLKNGLEFGLLFGLLGGLAFGLLSGMLGGLRSGLVFGLMSVLMSGLILALLFGGSAVINHYLLRLFLQRSGHIPRHYEHFLDYAVERLFLRRVGGSYVFVHRLLMEHFAAMWGKI